MDALGDGSRFQRFSAALVNKTRETSIVEKFKVNRVWQFQIMPTVDKRQMKVNTWYQDGKEVVSQENCSRDRVAPDAWKYYGMCGNRGH